MTNSELETVVALERVRRIRIELDQLDPSVDGKIIEEAPYQSMRLTVRGWERELMQSITIRKERSRA